MGHDGSFTHFPEYNEEGCKAASPHLPLHLSDNYLISIEKCCVQ